MIKSAARALRATKSAGQPISLTDQIKQGPIVLVVLRGYPGYQCPICTQQFAELMQNAKAFADANATVVFVYPGPAADLDKYAAEFVAGKQFPPNYRFLIDPDFKFTNLYNLRIMDRKRDALVSTLRAIFVPTLPDWQAVSLPAPLHSLYYAFRPLRLSAAYTTSLWRRMRRDA